MCLPDDSSAELGRLYEDYQQPIKGYLAKRSSDKEGVDDYYQDLFLNILENVSRKGVMIVPQTDDHRRNWLYRIATNLTIDDYRRKKNINFQPLQKSESLPELTVEGVEDRTDFFLLQEEVPKLPPMERVCFVEQHIMGHTQKEIAAKYGISEAAVSMNVSRASAKLRSKLYPVTIDLLLAEASLARDAMNNLMSGISGVINVAKIAEHEEKARDWRHRNYMKKNINYVRNEVRVDDLSVDDIRLGSKPPYEGMYTRSGLWVPNGIITRDPEELVPFNVDGLHKPTKQRRTNAKQ